MGNHNKVQKVQMGQRYKMRFSVFITTVDGTLTDQTDKMADSGCHYFQAYF
jgi:hypothetical protein